MSTRRAAFVILLVIIASQAWAATYHVDKAGSDANSCATAQSGGSSAKLTINNALTNCVQSGDTLLIHAGTYTETINSSLGNVRNGTGGTHTTIQAAPGETVILNPAAGEIINLVGRDLVKIAGLTLDPNNTADYGISINSGSNLIIENNEITRVLRNAFSFSTQTSVPTNITLRGNHIHDSGTSTNPSFLGHGIYYIMANSLMEYNRVERVKGWGIHAFNNPGDIHDNIIRWNYVKDANQGDVSGTGILIGTGDNNVAYGNIVENTQGAVKMVACFELGYNSPTNNAFYNNTGYGCSIGQP